MPLSARTRSALDLQIDKLAAFLRAHPDVNLADVAFVQQVGRRKFSQRSVLLADAGDALRAASLLESRDPQRLLSIAGDDRKRPVVFLFPGQGSQYVGMGRQLYETEEVFRDALDRCAELLRPTLTSRSTSCCTPQPPRLRKPPNASRAPLYTQPALFAVEYALSQLWIGWGVTPQAMIGHSIGEYVAACLSGVMSLEDAIRLVALRGRLMDGMPRGAMLAVALSEQECNSVLGAGPSLAAINGPASTVISGSLQEISEIEARLAARRLPCKRLATSHAFHSSMMEPVLAQYVDAIRGVALAEPQVPYLSNVTGTWMRPEDATDPEYYGRQLRQPVRLADGLGALLGDPDWVFLEVGPGGTLSSLTRQQVSGVNPIAVTTLGTGRDAHQDTSSVLDALGRLWLNGVAVPWPAFSAGELRNRIPLPTYPFERQRYWVGPADKPIASGTVASARRPPGDWFYVPSWVQVESAAEVPMALPPGEPWLVFADTLGVAQELARQLRSQGVLVTTVTEGDTFGRLGENAYSVRADVETDYDELLGELEHRGASPRRIVHLWLFCANTEADGQAAATAARTEQLGFRSLMCLAQAIGRHNTPDALHLDVVSNRLQTVASDDRATPAKALVLGPCRVMPAEYPSVSCRSIDLVADEAAVTAAHQVLREITAEAPQTLVAYRNGARWLQAYEAVRLDPQRTHRH